MTQYIYQGQAKTQGEIRASFPNTSLPKVWSVELCNRLGITPIMATPKPETAWNEVAVLDGWEIDSKGNTVQKWLVKPMFTEYTTEEGAVVTVAEQEAELQVKLMQDKAKSAEQAVQTHINAKCVELGYDNENSIAKYLVEGNPFYTECKAISLWISDVWVYTHQVQADVVAGLREIPTNEELLAELPDFTI